MKPDAEIFEEIKARLYRTRCTWLMVYDNVESPDIVKAHLSSGVKQGVTYVHVSVSMFHPPLLPPSSLPKKKKQTNKQTNQQFPEDTQREIDRDIQRQRVCVCVCVCSRQLE